MVDPTEAIHDGICYRMHNASPATVPCLASYQSMMQGAVCGFMFFYMLKKISKAHKRALAGYAKNTINIASHGHAFFGCTVFYVVWGIGSFFDLNRDYKYHDLTSPGLGGSDVSYLTPLILGATICRSFTNFLESYVVVLLISDSIGKDTFRRAVAISVFLSLFYVPSILIVIIWFPGHTSIYWPLRNLAILYLVRDVITVSYHFAAYLYTRNRKSAVVNHTISTYLLFMCLLYSSYTIARICYLTTGMLAVNFGICVDDLLHFVQFIFFGPFVYLALKRDCQYWATDIDNENELTLVSHTENMAWSEINDKSDAIIPKTEIYFRKTIEERCDVSVEIHFWRRRQVVVKRFKLDLLTRDNIKYFKDEASVFKTLHHPNVIAFYGILVDPPSLGIVMQYASRGDLFKYLEERFRNWRAGLPMPGEEQPLPSRETLAASATAGAAGSRFQNDKILEEGINEDHGEDSEGASSSVGKTARPTDAIPPPPLTPSPPTRRSSLGMSMSMSMSMSISAFGGSGSSPRLLPAGTPSSSGNPGVPSSGPGASSPSFMSRLASRTSFFGGSPQSPASALAMLEMSNRAGHFHSIRCALQIALGMNYLHSNNVCHRDLKSLNILLDDKFNAMIADFGESKFEEDIQFRDSTTSASDSDSVSGISLDSLASIARKGPQQLLSAVNKAAAMMGFRSTNGSSGSGETEGDEEGGHKNTHHHHRGEVGTPGWAAPECLEGSMATKSSDVFSFGIILWELCTWIHPSIHVPVCELVKPPLCNLPGVEEWLEEGGAGRRARDGPHKKGHHHHHHHHNRHSIGRIISSLIGEDADSTRRKSGSAQRDSLEKRVSQMNPQKLVLIDACEARRARTLMLELRRRPPVPPSCHPLLAGIMLRCWSAEQSLRPTFAEIISDLQRALGEIERDPSDEGAVFPLGLGGRDPEPMQQTSSL